MNSLWQMWSAGVDNDNIEGLIAESEKYPIAHTNIGFDGASNNDNYRSSEIKWVDSYQSPKVKELLWNYAEIANRNAFGFDISYLRDIQYTKYHSSTNDKYDWHVDTFWANPTMFDRKLSIVIQLSDPSDYEGGDFQFESQYENPDRVALRQKGTVLVFPSFLMHRVTPVTKGTRKSLVAWIEGPSFR